MSRPTLVFTGRPDRYVSRFPKMVPACDSQQAMQQDRVPSTGNADRSQRQPACPHVSSPFQRHIFWVKTHMAQLAAGGVLCDRREGPRVWTRSRRGGPCSGRGDAARPVGPPPTKCFLLVKGLGRGACSAHPVSTDYIGHDSRDRGGGPGERQAGRAP